MVKISLLAASLLVFVAAGPASAAELRLPMEIEVIYMGSSLQATGTEGQVEAGVVKPRFQWTFSREPIVLVNAGRTDPPEALLAYARKVSTNGAEIVVTRPGGFAKGKNPFDVRILAVVPEPSRQVAGGRQKLNTGDKVAIPETLREAAASSRRDIAVVVNAMDMAGRPLAAAAFYELPRSRNGYRQPSSFEVKLTDSNGSEYLGQAEVTWLAVVPRQENPFISGSGGAARIEIHDKIRSATAPLIVASGHKAGREIPVALFHPGWVKRQSRRQYSGFISTNEKGRATDVWYIGVEEFHETFKFTECRVEPLDSRELHAPPHFLAAAEALNIRDLERDAGLRGRYIRFKLYPPSGKAYCYGSLTFDVHATGTIQVFRTPLTPATVAVGLYRAEIVAGLIDDGSTNWRDGGTVVLWRDAGDDWREEFKRDVGDILVGTALTIAVGNDHAARALTAILTTKDHLSDRLACDSALDSTFEVELSNITLYGDRVYKVYTAVDGDVMAGSMFAGAGYAEIDFTGAAPNDCDASVPNMRKNKKLRLQNLAWTSPRRIGKSGAPSRTPLSEQTSEKPAEPTPSAIPPQYQPGPSAPGVLVVHALDDKPQPVRLRLEGWSESGKALVDTRISFAGGTNAYVDQSVKIPPATARIRLTFTNDAWQPNAGPDGDRNAFIDYVEWNGQRIEAEAFSSTGGCRKRQAPERSGGHMADCGDNNDWIELALPR